MYEQLQLRGYEPSSTQTATVGHLDERCCFCMYKRGNVAESFPASDKLVHVEILAVPECRCADILLIFLA